MLNAIVMRFFFDHTREAIIRLEKERIINIKYWYILYWDSKDTGFPMQKTSQFKQFDGYMDIPDKIYDNLYKKLYFFINTQNRWENSVETADHVHDFNLYLKKWYYIFKKNNIDIILFGAPPHDGEEITAYLLAKELKIKTIIVDQVAQLNNRFICSKSVDRMGYNDFNFCQQSDYQIIENKFEKNLFYMKDVKETLSWSDQPIFEQFLKELPIKKAIAKIKKEKIIYCYRNIAKIGYKLIYFYLRKCFQKHRNDLCVQFNKDKKYVYFPLHLQPEMTTDTLGGIYEDQLLAIERLSKLIPADWYIYIKENPAQSYYKRSSKFFERLKSIKKAVLIFPETNTYDLMKYSQLVATITGTAGWEAITGGKNVIIFGFAWYRTLPGVFEYNENLNIYDVLNYKIEHEVLERKFNEFYNKILLPGVVSSVTNEVCTNFNMENNIENVFSSLKMAIQNY